MGWITSVVPSFCRVLTVAAVEVITQLLLLGNATRDFYLHTKLREASRISFNTAVKQLIFKLC